MFRIKLTIKTPEGIIIVVIVNFEKIPHIILMFPLLALNK